MVFNSFQFVVFFAIVYALYRSVPHRQQNWMLLLASYYFYGSWDWRFLVLLLASTLIDYLCALYIDSRDDPVQRKRALIVSLGFNLSMLGFFISRRPLGAGSRRHEASPPLFRVR